MNIAHYMASHGPVAIALFLGAIVLTFVPTVVALIRRHPDLRLIFILNLLFFWTWTAWVGLLGWAIWGIPSNAIQQRIERFRAKRVK